MTDNLKGPGPADHGSVNVNDADEVRYWSQKFSCTEEELQTAVKLAGVAADKVEAFLRART